jgi:hypothetical protein
MTKTIAQLQADLQANLDRLVAELAEQHGFETGWTIPANMRDLALEMEPESGCLTVWGNGDRSTTAFTPAGGHRREAAQRTASVSVVKR